MKSLVGTNVLKLMLSRSEQKSLHELKGAQNGVDFAHDGARVHETHHARRLTQLQREYDDGSYTQLKQLFGQINL